MKIDPRIAAIAILPLAVGGLLVANWMQNRGKAATVATAASGAVDGSGPAPQDAIHEKAALEQELKQKPGHPPILLRLAELEQDGGHVDKAIAYLREVVQNDPKNEDGRLELGRALFETGDVQGALEQTENLVKDHPTNVDGLYNLGAIHANLSRNDLARQYWMQAVSTSPTSESGKRAQESLTKLGR
jgi:TolA-binding protein